MSVKYNPSDLVQVYLKELPDACNTFVSLQETVADKVLISQVNDQFNKHIDTNKAVEDWKKIASKKSWKKFRMHFTKAATKNQKCCDTLREIGITNKSKEQMETNPDNTEVVAKFQIYQAQKIEELMAHLEHL